MNNQTEISRPQTPPHQPMLAHTCLTEIEVIIGIGFSQSKLINVTAVPSSKSFNNRIYFLHLEHISGTQEDVVLKVNRRYIGSRKVQNEIGCLQMRYATCNTAYTVSQASIAASDTGNERSKFVGWILTSRVFGDPVPISELDDDSQRDLGRQMAGIVTAWCRKIPSQPRCGSIKPRLGYENKGTNEGNHVGPIVQGLVREGFEPSQSLTTLNMYYKVRLVKEMRELDTTDTYSSNRHLVPVLQKFLNHQVPQLKLAELLEDHSGSFVFTHYDLSPRNILVSGQPPRITGIVDFEFAGFFLPMEEFLNDYVGNGGDWLKSLYMAYLE
ncbi:hypothetical protein QQS21_002898 [Conoideocrella luteorostrata]|uniref:Aminoglycoside phosphotransferase domain-containing protein n=1 Tax=Conoideocrella luteorostrata TaxID=1105319 RepID=A0AAJ0FW30_9HYPO|nr:hypothetical protein QQS21_002898 [Conoideocrella luteorostrata]